MAKPVQEIIRGNNHPIHVGPIRPAKYGKQARYSFLENGRRVWHTGALKIMGLNVEALVGKP